MLLCSLRSDGLHQDWSRSGGRRLSLGSFLLHVVVLNLEVAKIDIRRLLDLLEGVHLLDG